MTATICHDEKSLLLCGLFMSENDSVKYSVSFQSRRGEVFIERGAKKFFRSGRGCVQHLYGRLVQEERYI